MNNKGSIPYQPSHTMNNKGSIPYQRSILDAKIHKNL